MKKRESYRNLAVCISRATSSRKRMPIFTEEWTVIHDIHLYDILLDKQHLSFISFNRLKENPYPSFASHESVSGEDILI
jgi:hypothetical protein